MHLYLTIFLDYLQQVKSSVLSAVRQYMRDKTHIKLRDSSSPHKVFSHHETCEVCHNYKSFPTLQALNLGQRHRYM
jgi:hypothetical protein